MMDLHCREMTAGGEKDTAVQGKQVLLRHSCQTSMAFGRMGGGLTHAMPTLSCQSPYSKLFAMNHKLHD